MKGDFSLDFEKKKQYYGVLDQQGRVQTDAENNERLVIQRHMDETTRRHVIGRCGAPQENPGFAVQPLLGEKGLFITPGAFYIDGILVENNAPLPTPIDNQPFLPGFTRHEDAVRHDGFYVAYLDVWQRHVTALEDSSIREVALGGPDTTSRIEIAWQVRPLRVAALDEQTPTSDQFGPDWVPPGVSAALPALRVRAVPPVAEENRLYRVEIHRGSDADSPVFIKWSRDNASVVTRVNAINGITLSVADPGRDATLGFAAHHWVEVTDEGRELRGEPGELVRLEAVSGTELTIMEWPGGAPPALDPQTIIVRRWDSQGVVPIEEPDVWMRLVDSHDVEDGIEVNINSVGARHGDYWVFAVRAVLGDVLWPRDSENNEPLAEPRHGIVHHYCALAILRKEGEQWDVVADCRRLFPSLTALPAGGDDTERLHITDIRLRSDNSPLRNDRQVQGSSLASRGLEIFFDDSISLLTVRQETFYVKLFLPYPLLPPDVEFWGLGGAFGRMPVVLEAQLIVSKNGTSVRWIPTSTTRELLDSRLFERLGENEAILAQLIIDGHFIWAENNPNRFLDGTVFGSPASDGNHTDISLPTGDGRRGGIFQLDFWVVREINTPFLRPGAFKLVDINTAREDELVTLPGIRPEQARLIIAARPWERVEDLQAISGLSAETLELLRERLTV
jgi:hypothetical protein